MPRTAGAPEAAAAPPVAGTPRRRRLADRAARFSVTAGGLAIIASILGILVFILVEVAPLVFRARVELGRTLDLGPLHPAGLVVDEYRERAVVVTRDARLAEVDLTTGSILEQRPLLDEPASPAGATRLDRVVAGASSRLIVAATTDGRVLLQPVRWDVSFEGAVRRIRAVLPPAIVLAIDPARRPLGAVTAALDDGGSLTAAAVLADERLVIVERTVERGLLADVATESIERFESPLPVRIEHLVLDDARRNLYGGSSSAALVHWRLDGGRPGEPEVVSGVPPVTALALLVGQRSLVVGHVDGSLSVWCLLPTDRGEQLARLHSFHAQSAGILAVAPSGRRAASPPPRATGAWGSTTRPPNGRCGAVLHRLTARPSRPSPRRATLRSSWRAHA